MKKEVLAGISAFLISVCVLLVNTRIICETLSSDQAGYVGTYLAATLISFVGTMVIGFVCNLPFVQLPSLGMTSSFIALLGAGNGLTYYNLLVISFFGALVYSVVMAIPASRAFVLGALPASVRKALPVGVGLYMISYAFNKSGIAVAAAGSVGIVDVGSLAPFGLTVFIACLVTFLAVVIFKRLKVSHPYLFGFGIGLIVFYALGALIAFDSIFKVDRGYIAFGAENMYTIADGFAGIEFGAVFTKGFDFSAYGGNVFTFVVGGILTYFLMGMYETDSSVEAAALEGAEADDKSRSKAFIVNAATNVIAPILGSAPVSVGKQSAIAAGDGGRTGLTAVTCGIGYFIALFTWLFFALFATYTATVSEYGHAISNSFAEYAQAGFAITDMAMLALGVFLLKGFADCNFKDIAEFIPFAVVVAAIAFMQNIVIGAGIGMTAYVLVELFSFKPERIKNIGASRWVITVLLLLTFIL